MHVSLYREYIYIYIYKPAIKSKARSIFLIRSIFIHHIHYKKFHLSERSF